nr:hypothetical protein [Tanacetum cinerariifolium]
MKKMMSTQKLPHLLAREDLEALWSLVKERFANTMPKNFSDDYLLITLGAMFEKPNIHAQIWKTQRSVYGLAKVKSWKLLESCDERMIAEMDQDVDVVLEDDKKVADDVKDVQDDIDESAQDQRRQAESQVEIYKIDLEHAQKITTEVVTAASETITAASTTITATEAQVPAATLTAAPLRVTAAPSRRRKGVVIRDPQEVSATSTIILAETKSTDKGKGILVEEPKPLKKQAQIEQDEQYARELEPELNRTIDWDEVIDHVNKKAKEYPVVKRYQALKRKPQTKAQARKNMLIYLKMLLTKEQIKEEESGALKRLNETLAEKAAKKQKLEEESPQVQPPSPQQQQPTQDARIPMDLFQTLLDTCTTLTRKVKHLELDKVAQAMKITKLKQRVKKLERRNKVKVLTLKRLQKVGTGQIVETSDDTVMDDVSNQGRMIAKIDQDADVVLEDDKKVADDVKMFKMILMRVHKIRGVVTAASETITTASTTVTVAEAQVPAATLTAAPSRVTATPSKKRKGVVIRDPEEPTTSTIIPAKTKSKDKGKEILVEEPKPLKKQAQIEQDKKYARELEAELNRNIDWDKAIDHVNRKAKKDPVLKRYQVMKRKPQTEAQARKNIMVYLKNVASFKIDYFNGMSYDDIRPIFEAKFNINVAFLQKIKEQIEEEETRALKRLNETPAERAAKRKNLDEEVEELKRHLQIVPNEEDDVYTEATSLARKVPVVDFEIINLNNKPYYKIKRADGTHQLYLSFLTLLKNFDREDLEALWSLVKERFANTKPKNFFDDFLLVTLRAMFEKPNIHAQIWKTQRSVYGPAKVKSWKLLESCGVQIIKFTTTHLILLVERKYPLTKFTLDQMLNAV